MDAKLIGIPFPIQAMAIHQALRNAKDGISIRESKTETVVEYDIPGVLKEDIKVSVSEVAPTGCSRHGGFLELSITTERKRPGHSRETSQKVPLPPANYNLKNIVAKPENGVLKVTLQKEKVKESPEIKIEIK